MAKEENFLGTEECTKTTGEFTNRVLLVSGNADIPEFCFNSCYACGEEVKINFRLGMGDVTPDSSGVWLAGGGNFEVPGGKYRMKDEDGDGVFELLVPRKKGFSSYFTFANGPCADYSCKEVLEGLPCGDPDNFNDRFMGPVNSNITFESCFGLCTDNVSCTSSTGDLFEQATFFTVKGNPAGQGLLTLEFTDHHSFDKQIFISNSVGQALKYMTWTGEQNSYQIDIHDLNPGLYFITVFSNHQTHTQKFVK